MSGGGAPAKHHKVVVIGGGTGGIGVSVQLQMEGVTDICIIEPSDVHYYQPLWTLVGGGLFQSQDSARPMSSVMPQGVRWVKDYVTTFAPEKNEVVMASGERISYDYLVVAAGLQTDWKLIPGLLETMGKNGVCSIYHPDYAMDTWKTIQSLTSGTAVFTQPNTPIKCGGAPQKIMWLTEDHLRRNGLRDKVEIDFIIPQEKMFAVKKYSDVLAKLGAERGIVARFGQKLVEVDGPGKIATFERLSDKELIKVPFDLLHVAPPMSAPDFIKKSPLANEAGYVNVDKYTLQHCTYKNVFGLGDCSSLPTSKTMAAITAQAPVLVHNLLRTMNGKRPSASYDGFTSCPIVMGYDQLLLTEFKYDQEVSESFSKIPLPFFDQGQPQWIYLLVKKYIFPFAYWELYMRGLWYGPKLIFKPNYDEDDRRVDTAMTN